MTTFPPLDITPMWSRINEELLELLDLVPDDKIDWSPKPEMWNFRGILLHICIGRHGLMQVIVQDGKQSPDIFREAQTRDGLKEQLRVSWQRMEPFLSDPELLSREYEVPYQDQRPRVSGHWLAFGQLEHDVHHRADLVHYLGLLGVEHPEPDTLARRLREGLT
ncbi:MAG: hypothetical protein A2148_06710 [Chloroflexi bacterium RBG_16_68_14]|nr:MAG: hypothetical protein A2148_06710 [Chloroflexi bacterium RBG_16_68_14]